MTAHIFLDPSPSTETGRKKKQGAGLSVKAEISAFTSSEDKNGTRTPDRGGGSTCYSTQRGPVGSCKPKSEPTRWKAGDGGSPCKGWGPRWGSPYPLDSHDEPTYIGESVGTYAILPGRCYDSWFIHA